MKIAIALSGGIDSLVSAHLLRSRGHDVLGIHFITGYEPALQRISRSTSENEAFSVYRKQMAERFSSISRQVDIPVEVMDLREAFSHHVVNYFMETYACGKTPNPCLACNPAIKFGAVLDFARSRGAEKLATGHYARIKTDEIGRARLLKGVDALKDQSYFLARLTPRQLAQAHFPLGGMTKQETVALAKAKGLKALTRNESQDICFIADMHYSDFLSCQGGLEPSPGPIVTVSGDHIGEHQGLHRFTIGQRRGINCPGPAPYYVVAIDMKNNHLVVGSKEDLYRTDCQVSEINWIAEPPGAPIPVEVRLRYRHQAVAATLTPANRDSASIVFIEPQPAVTPGQGAVFYQEDEVLGGGWID